MATILVTGGAGFIGSHVAEAYLAAGHRVMVVDDLTSGKEANLPKGAELHRMDIRDPGLGELIARLKPDVVNHHAAQISVLRSTREPRLDADINVSGSVALLAACAEQGVKRFIFASTGGALYGDPDRLPCDESHRVAPLSPYGVAKYCVEQYVGYFSANRGLPAVILRYGNVYGPRQDPHGEAGVVAIFTRRMLAGEQAFIFGTGDQERDFVYAGDVARANVLALTKGEGQAYNIGTGTGASVNQLYRSIARLTGCTLAPQHRPPNTGEVYRIFLDASKAQRELGWRPEVGLEEGLARTVEAFRAGG
jgi:UDP-glucose 4-epimerase